MQQADQSYTLWRWWRPQMMAKRRIRRRYYFDDGCNNNCAPYVLPGLCVVFILLGIAFLIAGFATPFWVYYDQGTSGSADFREYYSGLWTRCGKDGVQETICEGIADNNIPGWLKACEGLSVVSLLILLVALGFLVYWLCSYSRNIFIKVFLICAIFLTFLLIISVTIVYRVEGEPYFEDELTSFATATTDFIFFWSFYLFAISGAFVCLAGLFLLCIPAYGRHTDVYGDRVAITSRQPGQPVSTPPMTRPVSGAASMPINQNQYRGIAGRRPMSQSIQGYGTRGYQMGGYTSSSGYPGMVGGAAAHSMPRALPY